MHQIGTKASVCSHGVRDRFDGGRGYPRAARAIVRAGIVRELYTTCGANSKREGRALSLAVDEFILFTVNRFRYARERRHEAAKVSRVSNVRWQASSRFTLRADVAAASLAIVEIGDDHGVPRFKSFHRPEGPGLVIVQIGHSGLHDADAIFVDRRREQRTHDPQHDGLTDAALL